jgi:RimJ/RimL family protein N-acetyltransferase
MLVNPWQSTLNGPRLLLRPLKENDFEPLFLAASDPLIWEQHPDRERYTRTRFEIYFRSGMDSRGAFAIHDRPTGALIGSSRFSDHDPARSRVEIGYTFLTRAYWGKGYNAELKRLMLAHAFEHVTEALFVVGRNNLRSRGAMEKNGGLLVANAADVPARVDLTTSVVFRIRKIEWLLKQDAFLLPALQTPRLTLEPIEESHAQTLWDLFKDEALHRFVPFEPESFEKQRERCARWSKRRSPDGSELWLNWLARDRGTGRGIAHFQAGVKADGVASIGYVVAREAQGRGIATEGMSAVLAYLRDGLGAREAKAWSDTRNLASHRLASKLGMVQVGLIKNADHFKGASSDEYVFSKKLK